MRRCPLVFTVLFGVALTGCTTEAWPPIGTSPAEHGSVLWRLGRIYDEVPSTVYGLQFDTDLYVVSLPCLVGPSGLVSYPLRNRTPGRNIRFTHYLGPISLQVEDLCEDAPGREQAKYLETLERVSGYQIVNSTLILYDDQGHQALVFWAGRAVEPLPPMTDGLRESMHRARAYDAAQDSRRAKITEPSCES